MIIDVSGAARPHLALGGRPPAQRRLFELNRHKLHPESLPLPSRPPSAPKPCTHSCVEPKFQRPHVGGRPDRPGLQASIALAESQSVMFPRCTSRGGVAHGRLEMSGHPGSRRPRESGSHPDDPARHCARGHRRGFNNLRALAQIVARRVRSRLPPPPLRPIGARTPGSCRA